MIYSDELIEIESMVTTKYKWNAYADIALSEFVRKIRKDKSKEKKKKYFKKLANIFAVI